MFAAVQNKHAVNLHLGSALADDLSLDVVRSKDNFRIPPAFKNLMVHFLVAPLVAAVPAGSVGDNFTAGLACRRVKAQYTLLQRKRAVHGMERAAKRPMNF